MNIQILFTSQQRNVWSQKQIKKFLEGVFKFDLEIKNTGIHIYSRIHINWEIF